MKYIGKTKDMEYERTGTFFTNEETGEKFHQHSATFEERHIVKMPCGTNIVLSDDDIEELIPLLRRIKEGEEKPEFETTQEES